jgi:D-mannonate dehydratase
MQLATVLTPASDENLRLASQCGVSEIVTRCPGENLSLLSETFHDNGPTDMVAAMKAYREIGFAGPIRPDHVPQLSGEDEGEPGYTTKGRLFAWGYMRGLMQATEVV